MRSLPTSPEFDSSSTKAGASVLAGEFWELTKPRLSMLTVITALVGYLAASSSRDLLEAFALLVGTSLAAGACGALNQVMERDLDSRMARTRTRPLPAGRISLSAATWFGLFLAVSGTLLLFAGTNAIAALLTLATILSYLLVYTPLKTRSPLCTIVGAFPGALPPLIGWAAAEGSFGTLGWILFGILFAWQIPHFMAIAWNHRKDYAKAGMPMAPVVDPSGRSTAVWSLAFTGALVMLAVLPSLLGMASWVYGGISLLVSLWFLQKAWLFYRADEDVKDAPARRLFLVSLLYLPLVLGILVIDRWLMAVPA